jgi:hypothetical protein
MQQSGQQQGGMPPQGGMQPGGQSQGGMPPQGQGQGGACGAPPQNGQMPQPGGNANGQAGQGPKRIGPQFTNADIHSAIGNAQHQVSDLPGGGKQDHLSFQLSNGQGPRFQVQLDRKQSADGKATELHQQLQADDPNGRKFKCDRQTVLGVDGTAQVTVTGTIADPTVGNANLTLKKTVRADGTLTGTGTITLPATGETVTFDLDDVEAPEAPTTPDDTLVITPSLPEQPAAAAIGKEDE